jgi:UDP-3-O-[3-hydroxymyristoyl] glucosamine N-acyltransferase
VLDKLGSKVGEAVAIGDATFAGLAVSVGVEVGLGEGAVVGSSVAVGRKKCVSVGTAVADSVPVGSLFPQPAIKARHINTRKVTA